LTPANSFFSEIARRLAKLTNSPFLRTEATKYTEVGFHGRDVEQIVRDLVRVSLTQQRDLRRRSLESEVRFNVERTILRCMFGESSGSGSNSDQKSMYPA